MMSEAEALSNVICDVYDAALDPRLWQKALESTCAFVGGFSAALFWHDAATTSSNAVHLFNENPEFTRLYFDKYVHLNPLFPAAAFMEPGTVATSDDLVPRDEIVETRFWKEWVAPQGIADALVVVLERGAATAAFFSIRRSVQQGFFDDEALRRTALLVPHLQRAVAIGRLFDATKAVEAALTETLDHVEAGVFLVGADGQIAFANAPAETMLDQGTLLIRQRNTLVAIAPEANRCLKACIAGFGTPAAPHGQAPTRGEAIDLRAAGKDRWFANVLPLTSGARRQAGLMHEAVAAVFVRKAAPNSPSPLEMLAKRYELTASETRVMDGVLKASGVKAVADLLGVSPATVKTHLKNIFRKTGAARQSDLVKLVAGMNGPDGAEAGPDAAGDRA